MSLLTLQILRAKANKPTEFELRHTPLKPCPFCGKSEVYFDSMGGFKNFVVFIRLICGICGACAPYRDCRINAMKIWNKRGLRL